MSGHCAHTDPTPAHGAANAPLTPCSAGRPTREPCRTASSSERTNRGSSWATRPAQPSTPVPCSRTPPTTAHRSARPEWRHHRRGLELFHVPATLRCHLLGRCRSRRFQRTDQSGTALRSPPWGHPYPLPPNGGCTDLSGRQEWRHLAFPGAECGLTAKCWHGKR
jgi:hypothetical protein